MWIIERSKVVGISEVENWDKNPREIMRDEYESLKKQIRTLGVYKPLLCTHENGKYIAIGGNMRLRALKELKFTEAWISVIEVDSEEEKIRISLSDNNRAGYYREEATAELLYPYKDKTWKDYKLDFEMPKYDLDSFNKDQFEDNELLEEKEEDIKPFKKVHILLSFPPEKLVEIESYLEKILKIEDIEYEQSAN